MATAFEFRQYSVRFGDFRSLDDINLQIQEGWFVAIVGPNGAGKSTLLKSLLGLASKDGDTQVTGTVRVFNEAPEQIPPEWIGYVPQVKGFDRSFPALALEVVVSGLRGSWPFIMTKEERKKAAAVLEKVGASHLAYRRLGRLSGGELQRVYLARSLVRQPKLLLLDEPATGVDVVGEADLYKYLEVYQTTSRKGGAGATVVMITHDWEAAQHHASQVLLINRRVVAFGPPEQALRHESLAQAFGHMGHRHGLSALG